MKLGININDKTYSINTKNITKNLKKATTKAKETIGTVPKKARNGFIATMMILPTLGVVVNQCSDKEPKNNNIELVQDTIAPNHFEDYVDVQDETVHIVQSGDNLGKIAKKYNVSTIRLKAANPQLGKIIYPNDEVYIPRSYTVKNVKNLDDIEDMFGFSKEFLNNVVYFEQKRNDVYVDKNGNKTIGIGHLIQPHESDKYTHLTDKEVYTLFAQDLLNFSLNLEAIIGTETYAQLPTQIEESLIDLTFNKGEGAVTQNKDLRNAISKQDYAKIISNLNQDYSIVTKENGEQVKVYSSGLNKRRLYDMANAAKIYKDKIPQEIIKSAKVVYRDGIKHMQDEKANGTISEASYENVLNEYKTLAYKWFNGKIGENKQTIQQAQREAATQPQSEVTNNGNSNVTIKINGEATTFTVQSLYKDWENVAKTCKRPFKRPMPTVDKNGNLTATVKVLNPSGSGKLNGKTIIINPGHGGAMNHKEENGKLNVNFDPGTSNAIMNSNNPNLETNNFIGNGGKALEEWIVNQKIADNIAEKITKAGGKVIYVQGSVYSAQKSIREIQNSQKVDMILSLHSNSDGDKRGIYIIGNKRAGIVDKKDKELADMISTSLTKDDWFRGITHSTSQSLGVLSMSITETSPIPGVLIETGNLKNESDVANLNSSAFKTKLIDNIYNTIETKLSMR